MSKPLLSFAITLTLLTSALPAHAYMDPGTGTLIVQSIIGGTAAALTMAGVYIAKIRSGFGRILNRGSQDESTEPRP